MPFYHCIVRRGLIDQAQKEALARGITDLHCRLTGAPRYFVHVVFGDLEAGDAWCGGEASAFSFIRAGHRAGRPAELKQQLLTELAELWHSVVPEARREHLMITLTETGAGNVMEGGMVLPEPKDDAEWKARTGIQ